jgi:hypothetical protein
MANRKNEAERFQNALRSLPASQRDGASLDEGKAGAGMVEIFMGQMEELRMKLAAAEAELKDSQEDRHIKAARLAERDKEAATLKQKMEVLQKTVKDLKDSLDERSGELESARKEATANAPKAEESERERARLGEKLARLQEDKAQLLKKLEDTRHQLGWQARLDRASEELGAIASAVQASQSSPVKLGSNDLASILGVLLPGLHFIRDSVPFLAGDLDDPAPVYRLLRALDTSGGDIPAGAKQLEGVRGWWELYYRIGQRENGRLYFRLGGERKDVLVSSKNEQDQDLDYLRRI